jgi:hypothetical protein
MHLDANVFIDIGRNGRVSIGMCIRDSGGCYVEPGITVTDALEEAAAAA